MVCCNISVIFEFKFLKYLACYNASQIKTKTSSFPGSLNSDHPLGARLSNIISTG